MIPAVIGAVGLGLGTYHSVGQLIDNRKYWDDYRKNTGVSNRYYWKSGAGDWARYGSRSLLSVYGFRGLGPRKYTVNRYITNRNHYHYNHYDRRVKYSDVIRYR